MMDGLRTINVLGFHMNSMFLPFYSLLYPNQPTVYFNSAWFAFSCRNVQYFIWLSEPHSVLLDLLPARFNHSSCLCDWISIVAGSLCT